MITLGKILGKILKSTARWYSDELYLKLLYRAYVGYPLNLKDPKSFNAKLQWLKLYDRNPLYTRMVDKYEAKKYAAGIIGDKHIISTLHVYDSVEDIDFDALPNQFVLKCTHDSGGVVICKDKFNFKKSLAIKKLRKGLKKNFYWENREWPYKNVPRRIIAEVYMEDKSGELNDYKFFCFNGKVLFFKIDFDRFTNHHANYYSPRCELLPFGEAKFAPIPERQIRMPYNLSEMILFAEKLSSGCPFLRVDFYEVNKIVYFGELTFFPDSGFGKWTDEKWDNTIGDLLHLPNH